jgi:LmbE family N-acetylglucosaminyl deacetylase
MPRALPELGDTILSIWAHPDDETYLSSGLMARAAREGIRVVCVTATRGEGGSLDEERWPSATLGAIREQELLRCLAILGITEHVFLDLPDIGMDSPLPDVGAGRVLELMEEIKPDTVLTFGPDGMTGHLGHISVSDWTTDAFAKAAPAGSNLYYACQSEDWAAEILPRLQPFAGFRPGTPPVFAADDLAIAYELDQELMELKLRAIHEHTSQVEGMLATLGDDFFRVGARSEYFQLGMTKST